MTSGNETSKEKRQRLITDRVVEEGSCTPQRLAELFDVSLMTIHRDLDELERRGLVRKYHGGVTAQPSGVFESLLSYRMIKHTDQKEAIAKVALRFVEPGMSLMFDDSTTCLPMIPGLADKTPIHVATTFLPALHQLADIAAEHELTIMGFGGMYDIRHESFIGMQCIEQIQSIRADALFVSAAAVSGANAFHQEEPIVALKRAMIDVAAKRYLLVDHSKLGRTALHKVAPLDAFDLIITDAEADPEFVSSIRANGVPVEVAS